MTNHIDETTNKLSPAERDHQDRERADREEFMKTVARIDDLDMNSDGIGGQNRFSTMGNVKILSLDEDSDRIVKFVATAGKIGEGTAELLHRTYLLKTDGSIEIRRIKVYPDGKREPEKPERVIPGDDGFKGTLKTINECLNMVAREEERRKEIRASVAELQRANPHANKMSRTALFMERILNKW